MTAAQRQKDSGAIGARLARWMDVIASTDAGTTGSRRSPTVAGYWPLAGEPDLTAILRALDAQGIPVVLPVMAGRGLPLEFHRWRQDETLLPGPFGVMQPVRSQPLVPDIILVPSLGYTRKADRIGYGAGFYDRTLATLQKAGFTPLAIGIGWREGRIDLEEDAYRPQAHDMPLAAILTPDGWWPAEPRAGVRP